MHFVARIVVERVEEKGAHTTRQKVMIANIAVSGPDLDTLKQKAAAHLDLIEDGGDIDNRVMRGE